MLGGEGDAAAWVTCVKGIKRLQLRTVVEEAAGGAGGGGGEGEPRRLAAGGEGVALQAAHVARLREASTLKGVEEALGSAEHLTFSAFEACLDAGPRTVAAAGGTKRCVALWVSVLMHEQVGAPP